jgi:putative addiction module component (TIGR02574 family)
MSSVDIQEILKLSVAQRLRLVEDIWDSIAASPDALPVTDAQRCELDRRLAEYRLNPTAGRTWQEVRDSLSDDE